MRRCREIRNIVFLGLISFFMDVSSEMVYPIIPLYLTAAFGATPSLVGVIEGIAESTASLLKVFSGYITDKYKKKKPIAFAGYATGLLYKLALLFAGSWAGILAARVIDRLGKGIRTAPRDVMVSESTEGDTMGKAFGVHKALDMAGSALGIILSYILLKGLAAGSGSGQGISVTGTDMVDTYRLIFIVSIVPTVLALLIFDVYCIFTAMTAGVERALIAEIAPTELKGTMLGLHSTVSGVALLPASVICGFLWDRFGTAVPFLFGAGMSMLAAVLLMVFFRQNGEADN